MKTRPIPPSPIWAVTSYCPRRVPIIDRLLSRLPGNGLHPDDLAGESTPAAGSGRGAALPAPAAAGPEGTATAAQIADSSRRTDRFWQSGVREGGSKGDTMRNDLTEVAVVMDRSGSMEEIRQDAMGSFNAFLAGQKSGEGELRLTLVLFNHEMETVYAAVPVATVPPLDEASYVPGGTTALHDAMGRTIDELGARLAATPEAERPGKVTVAILTDGRENASHDYTLRQVRHRVRRQREKYGWQFVFLAAGQDAVLEGGKLAIPAADAISFQATSAGIHEAASELSERVTRRRRTVVN